MNDITIFDYIVFAVYIAEGLIGDILYSEGFSRKNSNKIIHYIILISGFLVMFLLFLFRNLFVNLISFISINLILLQILYNGTIYKKTSFAFFYTACMYITELVGVFILKFWEINEFNLNYQNMIYMTIISKMLLYIIIKASSRIITKREYPVPAKYFSILVIISSLNLLFMYCFDTAVINIEYSRIHYLIIVAGISGLALSNILIFFLFEKVVNEQQDINKANMNNHVLLSRLNYYKTIEEKYKNSQMHIHDMKKHFNFIKSYLHNNEQIDTNKKIEVDEYVNCLEESIEKLSYKRISKNNVINTILNEKLKVAAAENIQFDVEIDTKDFDFIKDIDLCAIFSNILDNAIESCKNSEIKKIKLDVYTINDNSFIFIKLKNSCYVSPVILNGKLVTRKTDNENHGYGMEIISLILKKYNGEIRYNYNNEKLEFITVISIPYIIKYR